MNRSLLPLFMFLLSLSLHVKSAAQKLPDFAALTRSYLVSLSPKDVSFIFKDNTRGTEPNYNWSLSYGYSPICTIEEVEKIRDVLGRDAFGKYGELINFGWLYDLREFEPALRNFQTLVKKDKSQEARIIQHVVEKALEPKTVEQQKHQIENEIARNEKRLSERSGLTREQAADLAKQLSRRFKSCLGRYQTGYISLTVQLINH